MVAWPDQHFANNQYDLALVGFVERANNKKDPGAMHNIGWLIENGHTKNGSLEDASDWYHKAVTSGRKESALALYRVLFRRGEFHLAYDWAEFAYQNGVPRAKEARKHAAHFAEVKLPWWG